jgi:hypothetical protein
VTRTAQHPFIGAADVLTASLLLFGVWGALPARWWPVDVFVSALAGLLMVCGVALVVGARWARPLGIFTAVVALLAGCGLVTLLAATASELAGMYGPVGLGSSIILWVVFFLLVPYLVILPSSQLFVLLAEGRERRAE